MVVKGFLRSCIDRDKIPCIIQTRAETENLLCPLVTTL
jgi:hypothetical protein